MKLFIHGYGIVRISKVKWLRICLQDSDREVATTAARALAGVVVAAHSAADLEANLRGK